jgi:plastocyanin
MTMRPLPLALILALLVAAPAAAAPREVTVGDDFFVRKGSPPTVKVRKGKVVKFVWTGSRQHNIVTVDGPGKAKIECGLRRSGKCKRTPPRIGTYTLQCSIHAPDMEMKLRVRRR